MSATAAKSNKPATAATTTNATGDNNVELLLKKDTNDLVKEGRKHYSIENGQGKFSDDFYEKMLPEDISMDTVLKLQQHDTSLVAATALIHGEAFLNLAKKDPKLQEFGVAFKAGSNTFNHVVKREGLSRNMHTGEVHKTFAVVSSSVKVSGAKGSKGELARVRKHIQTI